MRLRDELQTFPPLAAVLAGLSLSGPAHAQSAPPAATPEIVVTAPSPLTVTVKRGQRGDGLTVVDRSFSTVTFVTAGELLRNGGKTLGDQLSGLPGITNSGFAPGAAVRGFAKQDRELTHAGCRATVAATAAGQPP